jgi:hypothetical protein
VHAHADQHADENADADQHEHADEYADEHADEHADEYADENADEHADEYADCDKHTRPGGGGRADALVSDARAAGRRPDGGRSLVDEASLIAFGLLAETRGAA